VHAAARAPRAPRAPRVDGGARRAAGFSVRVRDAVDARDRQDRRDDARAAGAAARGQRVQSDTWRPPEPYAAACVAWVEDAFAAERALHATLAARRVHAHREFFRLTVAEARVAFALLLAA
jgi:hypothetical protein